MVYVLLGNGFEEIEALTCVDLLRRAGIAVSTVGVAEKTVTGSHGIRVEADILLSELCRANMEMIVLPGGLGGVAAVRASEAALDTLRDAHERGLFVAAICAGPTVLADLHITDGRRATCYPGMESGMGCAQIVPDAQFVRDGNLITGTSAGCAVPFALALVAALKGQSRADAIAAQIALR